MLTGVSKVAGARICPGHASASGGAYRVFDDPEDIPDFLKSETRVFKSARLNENGQYEFIFTEAQGANAGQDIKYVYGLNSSSGDRQANHHAAKENQSRYPWAQNIVSIGLLKVIKGRWACLPLSFRLYHQQKEIKNKRMEYRGKPIDFQNKLQSMKVLVAL